MELHDYVVAPDGGSVANIAGAVRSSSPQRTGGPRLQTSRKIHERFLKDPSTALAKTAREKRESTRNPHHNLLVVAELLAAKAAAEMAERVDAPGSDMYTAAMAYAERSTRYGLSEDVTVVQKVVVAARTERAKAHRT